MVGARLVLYRPDHYRLTNTFLLDHSFESDRSRSPFQYSDVCPKQCVGIICEARDIFIKQNFSEPGGRNEQIQSRSFADGNFDENYFRRPPTNPTSVKITPDFLYMVKIHPSKWDTDSIPGLSKHWPQANQPTPQLLNQSMPQNTSARPEPVSTIREATGNDKPVQCREE